jgi:hypothetical protein
MLSGEASNTNVIFYLVNVCYIVSDQNIAFLVEQTARNSNSIKSGRSKIKEGFVQNHDNMSEWNDMSIRILLFKLACTVNVQLGILV